MTNRDRRRLLWVVNGFLALCIVGALASLLFPPAASMGASARQPVESVTPPVAASPPPPLEAYAVIYQRNISSPLDGQTRAKAVPVAPPPAPPALTLTGTVVEKDNSFAMLRTPTGQLRVVRTGDILDGVTIVAITEKSITVTFQGNVFTLTVTPPGAKR
jgi:hypothetical protein